nr:2-hydroxychromene-2-carboxylate isomerase [uncultured Cohaesibacter sp.]
MSDNKTGASVDYYFSCISSFAYIGHQAFQDMAARLGLDVTYRPVQLGKVFAASGGLALGDRDPARNRYRMLELQRWSAHHGLEMNFQPKFFPTNPALADAAVIAVAQEGRNPAALMTAIMRKVWVEEANIAEREVIATCLSAVGEDADAILQKAQSDTIADIYQANTEQGIALDIIGSPCVVYQGEPFWGQDRFSLVEEAIQSGRPAFVSMP